MNKETDTTAISYATVHYTPLYYKEYNDIINNKVYEHTSNIINNAIVNQYAFFGCIIIDKLFQPFKRIIESCDIYCQSGTSNVDSLVVLCNGRRLYIEIKMRHDDDYIKYPKTCIGEKYKYDRLRVLATEANAEPYIIWVQKLGQVSIFNLNKIDEPRWFFNKMQRNNFEKKNEKRNIAIGYYFKKDAYQCNIPNFGNIKQFLTNELNLNF